MGPNARFGYPLKGGFQALMDGFLPHLKGELRLNTRVTRVSPRHRTVTFADGTSVRYEHLISTMPLPGLVRSPATKRPRASRRREGPPARLGPLRQHRHRPARHHRQALDLLS